MNKAVRKKKTTVEKSTGDRALRASLERVLGKYVELRESEWTYTVATSELPEVIEARALLKKEAEYE